jgi:hypothetical protein
MAEDPRKNRVRKLVGWAVGIPVGGCSLFLFHKHVAIDPPWVEIALYALAAFVTFFIWSVATTWLTAVITARLPSSVGSKKSSPK